MLLFCPPLTAKDSPELIQVLVQGPNPEELEQAITAVGGRVTHQLPIVAGVGGVINAEALDSLAAQPGVDRFIEDFNPPKDPLSRDCPVAGDLDVVFSDNTMRWRLHNFSQDKVTLSGISLSLENHREPSDQPDDDVDEVASETVDALAGEVVNEVAIAFMQSGDVQKRAPASIRLPADNFSLKQVLDVGITQLVLKFAAETEVPTQSEINLSLTLDGCVVELPKAYADNHGDYYYPSLIGADLLHDSGITGSGIGVAIIDSGLWDTPALTNNTLGQPRVTVHYNAITDMADTVLRDPGGHGSHMASIVSSSLPVTREGGMGYKGVAPNVSLIPVTAFASEGDGDFLDIIRGIQWVVDHRESHNIRVLNMSLSAYPRFLYWQDPINQAVMRAWAEGILVVAAAGNDGPDWGTIGSPGNNPYVVTVGAITDSWTPTDRKDDYIPDFSSRGPTPAGHIKPDLVAPGGHITGLVPADSKLATESPNYVLKTGEFVSTGSSQAAAVVSGAAALLFEWDPTLTNDELKCLLTTSAEPAINRDGRLAYSPFAQGSGALNIARAMTLGSRTCDQQSMDIQQALRGEERLYGPAEDNGDGTPYLADQEQLIANTPTPKGPSESRRWGVKAHIERLNPETDQPQAQDVLFDWGSLYEQERQQMQSLRKADQP